jgi:BirA family biotin operon repressor/biotin-[acetyl-CoA-carboxylase] ligase
MVNKDGLSTKAYLLAKLREADRSLTGSELALGAGISRVAVWKGIRSLQDAGYSVISGEQGYGLSAPAGALQSGDFLYPWEFGEQERNFHYWESTDSTMNRARELAEKGAESGTVITAGKQTSGRGRQGKSWASKTGGLFFTLLERPNYVIGDYSRHALLMQIAAARAIRAFTGKEALLKWPNDVYIENRKVAGVLTELYGEGDMLRWLTLGIGININNPVPSPSSVNCASLAKHTVSRREMLVAVLRSFSALKSKEHGDASLRRMWNKTAFGIGKRVRVTGQNETRYEGVFLGIDAFGRGIVKTGNTEHRLFPGEVSLHFKELS